MKKIFLFAAAVLVAVSASAQFDYTETSIYTLPLTDVFSNLVNCEFAQTAAPAEGQVTGKNNINLKEGGVEASFNMGASVKWSYTNSTAGATIAKQYGNYVQPNGKDRVITISASSAVVNLVEACSKVEVNGAEVNLEAGDNALTGNGSIVIKTLDGGGKPKISAIKLGTGINAAKAEVKATKVLENGKVVILKNGVRYNALGAAL